MEEIKMIMKDIEIEKDISSSSYDYLLNLPMWSLS